MQYSVIIEKGDSSYGAYVPDIPGCVAIGESRDETLELIKEALAMHLESMREDGEQIPPPNSSAVVVEV
jgi:predicted RNase H-like HicB family nuclease